MENFGLLIPQSMLVFHANCPIHVAFDKANKLEAFIEWCKENLEQVKIKRGLVNLWVRDSEIFGLTAMSLQEHFEKYCAPKEWGFRSYEIKK